MTEPQNQASSEQDNKIFEAILEKYKALKTQDDEWYKNQEFRTDLSNIIKLINQMDAKIQASSTFGAVDPEIASICKKLADIRRPIENRDLKTADLSLLLEHTKDYVEAFKNHYDTLSKAIQPTVWNSIKSLMNDLMDTLKIPLRHRFKLDKAVIADEAIEFKEKFRNLKSVGDYTPSVEITEEPKTPR